jgi:hypothetical protein
LRASFVLIRHGPFANRRFFTHQSFSRISQKSLGPLYCRIANFCSNEQVSYATPRQKLDAFQVRTRENGLPTAGNISIAETIGLLEGEFKEFAAGFESGMYAMWLGSGISRERVVGLDGVLAKLLESLRARISNTVGCIHRKALQDVLALAELSPDDHAKVSFDIPSAQWPCLKTIVNRLWNKYSEVLGIEVQGQRLDYLLWDVLDFKNTFSSQKPDAEHLAIGMLVLEGMVSELATANWDTLLESAMLELGQPDDCYRVAVKGDDLKGPAALATLYKFHGCAKRAVDDEATYRDLLVARAAAINQWSKNPNFDRIRAQLSALIARSRTLMIGLSAQDTNIQLMFGSNGWKWNEQPTPIIFSAQDLTPGQKSILEGAYFPEYEANREKICLEARLPAYSKALLLALLLMNMSRKVEALAGRVNAPGIDKLGKESLANGVRVLRDRVAEHGNADRFNLVNRISYLMGRFTEQFLGGRSYPGVRPYAPVHPKPTHQMLKDGTLAFSGQVEAAAGLGAIGLQVRDANWAVSVDDSSQNTSGAMRISVNGVDARLFFASTDDKVNGLIRAGAFNSDDTDVVVICSGPISQSQQRSPSANFRTGRATPRYIGIEEILNSCISLEDFRKRFVSEVGL